MIKHEIKGNQFYVAVNDHILISSKNIWEGFGKERIKEYHGHFTIKSTVKEYYPFKGSIELVSENPFEIHIKSSRDINRLLIKTELAKDEVIFGGGEQYSELNLKGKRFPLFVQEQGVGRGKNLISLLAYLKKVRGSWYSTYFPQPVFFSNKGYGIVFKTYAPMIVDLRKNIALFEIWSNECNIIVLSGTLEEMVRDLFKIFGGAFDYEDWMFGVWLASQGGTENIERIIKTAREWNIPVHAVWAQDWCGKVYTKFGRQVFWNWEYDKEDYHDLPEYIKKWHEEGIRFLGYINPFLNKEGNLYKEALEKGYLVKKKDGSVYDIVVTTFPAGLIDLSNPDAFEWYKSIILNNMISIGMDGWMADFGEYLPMDAVLKYSSGKEYHNKYPVEWARLNFEAVKASSKKVVYFMRAGFLGSTRFCPAFWTGDQNVDWSFSDGLPTVIPAMTSSSLCGVRHIHFDIGGYTSLFWMKRTPELFMRWTEIAAFSPVMRTHQTNRPVSNIQFDSNHDILRHFSKMANMHVLLIDYLKVEFKKAIDENLPVVKHLALNYPEDPESWQIKYQYLLGNDILVAPVLKKKTRKWKVFLPRREKWVHLWTEKMFSGGWIEIDAPLGEPPVFVRLGSEFLEKILAASRDVQELR